MDDGVAFAFKNALCTETATVKLESTVRARLRPACWARSKRWSLSSRMSPSTAGISAVWEM